MIGEEDRYIIDSFKDLKKDYPDKIGKLEGALFEYMGENYLKFLPTDFPDKTWKFLTIKLVYPYAYFNSTDNYQKLVDNLQKETSSVNSKMIIPVIKKIERTMDIIKRFNFKNREQLT